MTTVKIRNEKFRVKGEVKVEDSFKMYGHTFCVHHPLGANPAEDEVTWYNVTESKTGMLITTQKFWTIEGAIQGGKEKLRGKGGEYTLKCIKSALEKIEQIEYNNKYK